MAFYGSYFLPKIIAAMDRDARKKEEALKDDCFTIVPHKALLFLYIGALCIMVGMCVVFSIMIVAQETQPYGYAIATVWLLFAPLDVLYIVGFIDTFHTKFIVNDEYIHAKYLFKKDKKVSLKEIIGARVVDLPAGRYKQSRGGYSWYSELWLFTYSAPNKAAIKLDMTNVGTMTLKNKLVRSGIVVVEK